MIMILEFLMNVLMLLICVFILLMIFCMIIVSLGVIDWLLDSNIKESLEKILGKRNRLFSRIREELEKID